MIPNPEICGIRELNISREANCSFPLTVLPFLPEPPYTPQQELDLHLHWPCEVRAYWVSIAPFVSSVQFLLTYVTAFIVVLGLTMNTLSFLVLNSPPLCRTSLSVFLRALAISDNGALIFNFAAGLGRGQLPHFSRLFMDSVWICGSFKVLVDLFLFYSTWLVVGLTLKRLLVVASPLNYNFRCSVPRAKKIVCCIGVVSFSIACLKLKYSGYEQDSTFGYEPCSFKSEDSDKVVYVYIALSTWLPCLFIFVGNVLLIRHIRISNKARLELSGDRAMVTRWNDTHRMLGMLLTVSFACLLLMLPLGVVETFELYWDFVLLKPPSLVESARQHYIRWQQEKLLLKWIRGLFFWLYQWNFATNFFLYCLTGRKFRTAAAEYLRRCFACRQCRGQLTTLRRRLTRTTQPTMSTSIEMQENKTSVISK